MIRNMSHIEFIEKVKKLNPHYLKDFEIVGTYKSPRVKIKVINAFGEGLMLPTTILLGCNFCIRAALDPTNYFIAQSTKWFNGKYAFINGDVSYHTNIITLKCLLHNVNFEQRAHKHLQGSEGCPVCLNLKRKASNHGTWKASKWEEMGSKSKDFHGFRVYIIKCTGNGEVFYKVGKTFNTLGFRFHTKKSMPYNWEIITEIQGTAKYCTNLENQIIERHKEVKYNPLITFHGYNECFKELVNEKIF